MRNFVSSFRTIPRKIKCSEFDSELFRRRGILFRPLSKRKIFRELVLKHDDAMKGLSVVFFGLQNSVPFRSEFSECNFNGNHSCTAPYLILLKSILQSVLAYSRIRESSATKFKRCLQSFTYFFHFTITQSFKK